MKHKSILIGFLIAFSYLGVIAADAPVCSITEATACATQTGPVVAVNQMAANGLLEECCLPCTECPPECLVSVTGQGAIQAVTKTVSLASNKLKETRRKACLDGKVQVASRLQTMAKTNTATNNSCPEPPCCPEECPPENAKLNLDARESI